jgi:murein DD-endopeptidase MepM/ murein hydrolase activator NlpD
MQRHRSPIRLAIHLAALLSCIPPALASIPSQANMRPPVSPACISSPFGPRVLPNHPLAGTFHNGIDLPAPAGAPVRAVESGEVLRVERRGPGGLQILVQHRGFVGIYSHLGSVAPAIADGQRIVHGGEKLGVVGHSGVMYGMHLFFGMIMDGHAVDPAVYLALPLCHAGIRRPSDMLDADGKIPPTRHYALLRNER